MKSPRTPSPGACSNSAAVPPSPPHSSPAKPWHACPNSAPSLMRSFASNGRTGTRPAALKKLIRSAAMTSPPAPASWSHPTCRTATPASGLPPTTSTPNAFPRGVATASTASLTSPSAAARVNASATNSAWPRPSSSSLTCLKTSSSPCRPHVSRPAGSHHAPHEDQPHRPSATLLRWAKPRRIPLSPSKTAFAKLINR